jgi:hypothetical protein
MYNFTKNTYKGYKNPATITSILGHINSKNWKAVLRCMTGSIRAYMQGKRFTPYAPCPANKAPSNKVPSNKSPANKSPTNKSPKNKVM